MSTTMMNGINGVSVKNRTRLNSIVDLTSVDFIKEVNCVELPDVGEVQVKVVKGDFSAVPLCCQQFIARYVSTLYCNLLVLVLVLCFCSTSLFSGFTARWARSWKSYSRLLNSAGSFIF